MADKLAFEILADDRASQGLSRAGKSMKALAADVELANIRMAKAEKVAQQAVKEHGETSLQAREAIAKLAKAEDQAQVASGKLAVAQKAQADGLAAVGDRVNQAGAKMKKSGDNAEETTGRFGRARQGISNLKGGFLEATAVVAGFSGAVMFAGKVVGEGLQQGLIRANAQVTLGAEGYKKFAAQAASSAHALGLTEGEFINSAGQAALLAKNMGFGQETAVKFGTALPDLANKLSLMSSNTVDAATASDVLRSALAGEFDPLQAVGINISANIVAEKALAIQKANTTKLSSQQANALAVLQIVQEQTGTATGVLATKQGQQAQQVAKTTAAWRDQAQQIEEFVAPKIVGALDQVWKFDQKFAAALMDAKHMDAWFKVIDDANASVGIAGTANKGLASVLDSVSKKTAAATWTTNDYVNALTKEASAALGASNDEVSYYDAIDKADQALKENGKTIDLHTEKGRANQTALNQMGASFTAYLNDLVAQNVPASQFNQKLEESRKRLYDEAVAMGYSKTKAQEFTDKILGIPKKALTQAEVQKAAAEAAIEVWKKKLASIPPSATTRINAVMGSTIAALDGIVYRVGWINSHPAVVQVYSSAANVRENRTAHASGGWVRRAVGGWVPGSAHGPNRDSVPAMLVPGEFVVQRDRAQRNRGLLEDLNSGRVRGFAGGGMVGRPVGLSLRGGPAVTVVLQNTGVITTVDVDEWVAERVRKLQRTGIL